MPRFFYSKEDAARSLSNANPSLVELKTKLQLATKVVETLVGKDAFRYLSFFSILVAFSVDSLIPRGFPMQCCVGAVICAVEEIDKSTLFGRERGENVTKTLENRILLQNKVSQHFYRPL